MKKRKLNLLIWLLLSNVSGQAITTSVGITASVSSASNLGIKKYLVYEENNNGYIKPTTFDNTLHIDDSWHDVTLNGNFENGLTNWNIVSGSGAVTNHQSSVNHLGQYIWGSSTPGFTAEQSHDLTSILNFRDQYDYNYAKVEFDYGGWNSLDTIRAEVYWLDPFNGDNGRTLITSDFTGNKNNAFQHYNSGILNIPINTDTALVDLVEFRNSGSDSDGYLDNFSLKVRNCRFDGTPQNDHIFYPGGFTKLTYYVGKGGQDMIEPEIYTNYTYAASLELWNNLDGYVVIGNGDQMNAIGDLGNDTLVGYQNNTIVHGTYLEGGKGNDKLYAPVNDDNGYFNGGNGFDTIVFRGVKSDYTINHISGSKYEFTKPNGYYAYIKNIEAVAFTNENPLNNTNGNVNTEDLWVFNGGVLTDNFPTSIVNNARSVNRVSIPLTINGSTNSSFYINNLPANTLRLEDGAGNVLANVTKETNGAGEVKYFFFLSNFDLSSNPTLYIINDDDINGTATTFDYNNLKITKQF